METRICRFEEIEARELLSINPILPPPDINVGVVYIENHVPQQGHQNAGDLFTVTWNGGADGTTLDRLVIDTSSAAGNIFFSTEGNFGGDYNNFSPFLIVENEDGIKVTVEIVEDGGSLLVLNFENFTAGKTLVFSIDLNEYNDNDTIADVVEGKELEGTSITTTFSSNDYYAKEVNQQFVNAYTIIPELADKLPADGAAPNANHSLMAGASTKALQDTPRTGSLSGYVYEDNNNNGRFDGTEKGIGGVGLKLQVWDAENQRYVDVAGKTTVTDADGFYKFDNLDAWQHYRVVEDQPEGYMSGKNAEGTLGGVADDANDWIGDIPLGANEHGQNYNFGELKKGSLSGYVYEDNNNDGRRDAGEWGIEGIRLALYVYTSNGYELVGYTTTDRDGYYCFDDLDPQKTYKIIEAEQPAGYISGKNTEGTLGGNASDYNDWIESIPLGIGQAGKEYNFGELRRDLYAGSLSGYVYVDTNNNGKKEKGEAGIAGAKLTLWVLEGNGKYRAIATTSTDASGYYQFTDLDPYRTYRITEEQPNGYGDGLDAAGSLGGYAHNPGDMIDAIPVGLGDHGVHYNFGELPEDVPPPVKKPGSLSGYVYVDANNNGKKDAGEKGIGGVKLTLYKWDGAKYVAVASTYSEEGTGAYSFKNLDPEAFYEIREEQPKGYDDGKEQVGSLGGEAFAPPSDIITNIYLRSGEHGKNYNFGELEAIVVPPGDGSISGHVYEDDNDNGKRDPGEKGIGGVTLALCMWDDELERFVTTTRTVTTDENGYYRFDDLPPGTYCVTEIRDNLDDRYCDGKDSVGSLGGELSTDASRIYEIGLGEGENGINYDFGELRRGYLSGYVYADANQNGVKDTNESGIRGVKLSLWVWDEATKSYIKTSKTAVTGEGGYYIFEGLCPSKKYRIVEDQPTGFNDGLETVGSLGGKAYPSPSDIIDEIMMPVGGQGKNYNFGELLIPVDPPGPPVTPTVPVTPNGPSNMPQHMPGATGGYGPGTPLLWAPGLQPGLVPGHGGGGLMPASYSWHLSVINAGYPRDTESSAEAMALAENSEVTARFINVAWTPTTLDDGVWFVRDKFGRITQRFRFGMTGAKPLVGDFNGDGIDEIAVFHNGSWYIDINGNGVWDEEDLLCHLGAAGDQPLVGDWDGDGKIDIGIFGPRWRGDESAIAEDPGLPSDLNERATVRPKSAPPHGDEAAAAGVRAMKHSDRGTVRYDVIDHVFQYGGKGDIAVTGDFNGDGVTEIGVYRDGNWYIDYNGDGRWEEGVDVLVVGEMIEGAIPVVGDWNGEGIDRIGLFVNGQWMLDTTGDFQYDKTIEFGQAGDIPIVGDFSGDGISELAIYRPYAAEPLLTQDAPTFRSAEAQPQVAQQFSTQADASVLQNTLPEELMARPGRTMATPYTSLPLDTQ